MNLGCLIASLGVVSITTQAQGPSDFGFGAVPLPASRPVLLILPSYPGLTVGGTSLQWHELVFGSETSDSPPRYSVARWAAETSNGRFTYTAASLAMPVIMSEADSYNTISKAHPEWGGNDRLLNPVWAGRIVKALIDAGFDFARFDLNRNGTVQCPSELTICIVNPDKGNSGGVNRNLEAQRDPAGNVTVSGGCIIVGHVATFATILHEFGHSLGIPHEMYTPVPDVPSLNSGMSIMSGTHYGSLGAGEVFSLDWDPARIHFDPYHKLRFGWSAPRIVSMRMGGRFELPVATSGRVDAPVILYDPTRGTQEYFILEYRSRFQTQPNYDADFAIEEPVQGEGLVIWQVATKLDHSPFVDWSPTDPALASPAVYSSSILNRCPPDLTVLNYRPWVGGRETPVLTWFDGTPTTARVRVLPFPGRATRITVDVLADYETWVDFNYRGLPSLPETGAFEAPFNTLAEGVDQVAYGGRLRLKTGRTSATLARVTKPMRWESFGGSVVIGELP